MCGRRTIARFLGLLTTGLGICITLAAELKIKPAGSVQSQPAGKGFVLTCQGEAQDTSLFSEMKWMAPNEHMIEQRSSGPVEILQQGDNQLALIFKSPTTEESGLYRCTALYSKTDQLNISVQLTFYQDITWDDCPKKQALVINTTGNIRCKVSANPVATITWAKNNEPLPEDRYIADSSGITVSKVTEEDAGIYNMRAMVIQTGRFQNKVITVEVHVPPVITQLESPVKFKEGEEAAVTCHATGSPQPEYTWFDPKQQDLSNVDGYFVGKDTGTLTIRSVKKEDAGRYRCMAKNDAGESSKFMELNVIVKPEIKQFDNVSAPENKEATLECQASGEPLPELSIRKDGHDTELSDKNDDRISFKRREEGGRKILTVTIRSLRRNDDGLYYCSAENEGSKVERVGHLTVECQLFGGMVTADVLTQQAGNNATTQLVIGPELVVSNCSTTASSTSSTTQSLNTIVNTISSNDLEMIASARILQENNSGSARTDYCSNHILSSRAKKWWSLQQQMKTNLVNLTDAVKQMPDPNQILRDSSPSISTDVMLASTPVTFHDSISGTHLVETYLLPDEPPSSNDIYHDDNILTPVTSSSLISELSVPVSLLTETSMTDGSLNTSTTDFETVASGDTEFTGSTINLQDLE